ncbi:MAG: S41 family peptidase, partial [Bacteroidia bacterium]
MWKNKLKLMVLSVILLATLGIGAVIKVGDNYFEISKNLTIFGKLYRELNLLYVDETDPTKLMREAIDNMLASLDPYTNYISASEIEDFRIRSMGQYCGIGVLVVERNGKVIITEIYEGEPAIEAGLKTGDEIIAIDNENIKTKIRTQNDIRNLLRGQANTPVLLTVIREGETNPRKINVVRKDIKISNVPYFGMVNDKVGYITLTEFTPDAGKEVRDAFITLRKENPNLAGIILDLRENPGGMLIEAVNVASVFVPSNEMVVETRGRMEGAQKKYSTKDSPVDTLLPVAVLVNNHSASSSEIVTGALQDLDRAVIVGQRSFGKGLVQITRPLSYNTQMKLTTAKYYIPSGRCIQALDYSHRNPDGSVGKVPDSLKKSFKTKKGRTVYDGGGIEPDVEVKRKEYNTVTNELQNQGVIFDFASKFANQNAKIADAKSFKITDEIYQQFVKYVETCSFKYETLAEKELVKLKGLVESEHRFDNISAEYKGLEAKLKDLKKNELIIHKKDISELLKLEIVKRYYYRKGIIEASFDQDEDIKAATDVLSNKVKYGQLLSGKK